jgi:hypothetical protein
MAIEMNWLKTRKQLDIAEVLIDTRVAEKIDMAPRLRSMKDDEIELGHVLERMVKGMRKEMSTVLRELERSRDMSPEVLKNMVRTGLDALVGAVEKVINGVSDVIESQIN